MTRLEAICGLIDKCRVFADVGCDHGFISEWVLKNNLADTVIATDISAKCLKKAQNLLKGHQNVQFVCTDGLGGITAEQAVIAGLGGHTIINILKDRLDGTKYILQPQDHAPNVRLFLTQGGYRITHDFVAKDNDKFYDIIKAEPGSQRIDELEKTFGVFYREGDALLRERLDYLYNKYSAYNDNGKNDEIRELLRQAIRQITSKK